MYCSMVSQMNEGTLRKKKKKAFTVNTFQEEQSLISHVGVVEQA